MNNKIAINTYLSTIESKKKKSTTRTETDSDTENILTVARWGMGEKSEVIKKYKLVVTE